jgi:hypothetical protein
MCDDFGDLHGDSSVGSGMVDHTPDQSDVSHDTNLKTAFGLWGEQIGPSELPPKRRYSVNAW